MQKAGLIPASTEYFSHICRGFFDDERSPTTTLKGKHNGGDTQGKISFR
jgi:hypothetical protein